MRWDQRVDRHHYLGFKRFAGRGLRYIVEWRGQWLALAGWQSGAFKSRHRDRWVGWKRELRYRRLHLIGNNTRFVILSRPGVFPHLASLALAAMTRRLSQDWQAAYGHPLLIAESFVDPAHFQGTLYQAANWRYLGNTRGFARHNGRYTDPHGKPKRLYVYPLQRNARRRLRDPGPLPAAWEPKGHSERAPSELRSLYEELARVKDFRRAQGRKHPVASVLAVYVLAWLANLRGPVAAAEYASKLTQRELQAIGAWKNRKTGRYLPVSKSTLHRVIASVDPAEIEAVLQRFSMPRLELGRAVAVDGKRIRGANRNGAQHYETATLVEHSTHRPVAIHGYQEEGGETAAVRALLEQVPIRGRLVTIDALFTTREIARLLVEAHGADYLMSVKKNAPETHHLLSTICWERDATGCFREQVDKGHGRIQQTVDPGPDASPPPPQLPPRLPDLPHHSQTHRREASPNRRHLYRNRLRDLLGPRLPCHPPATARLEPRPLVGRSQPSHPRHHLRRRRLPRPHPLRSPKQRDLHQSCPRPHPSPHPLRQHCLGNPSLRAPTLRRLRTPCCLPELRPDSFHTGMTPRSVSTAPQLCHSKSESAFGPSGDGSIRLSPSPTDTPIPNPDPINPTVGPR